MERVTHRSASARQNFCDIEHLHGAKVRNSSRPGDDGDSYPDLAGSRALRINPSRV